MFKFQHIKTKTSNNIILNHSKDAIYARIDLNLGGSLQELILNGKNIISSKATLPYKESYASAILFPFANRIERGRYVFNKKVYQLAINKVEENNAIHGLIYNKSFEMVHHSITEDSATIHIRYIETEKELGFPFKYIVTLTYVLKKDSLQLIAEVKNTGEKKFPFTIGWHPYFQSESLSKTIVDIHESDDATYNQNTVESKSTTVEQNGLEIANNVIDDCYTTEADKLFLKTPNYQIELKYSPTIKYIQVYTPKNRKSIALEPQTGPANSFNNGLGLEYLEPNELRGFYWTINLKT